MEAASPALGACSLAGVTEHQALGLVCSKPAFDRFALGLLSLLSLFLPVKDLLAVGFLW